MPTRRTSPRRTATRPGGLYERTPEPPFDDADDAPDAGFLQIAAPWLALLAIVLAAGAVGYVVFGRSSDGDLTACRSAAWGSIPDTKLLPTGWSIGSTDLSANGMTISLLGATAPDATDQPVVVVSVTCYGGAAETALDANRDAAAAARATVAPRTAAGDAYDVDNPATGGTTTFFRVGGLVAQVADSGTVAQADREAITAAFANAMGDRNAAGIGAARPTDGATASEEPLGSDDPGAVDPSSSPFAADLEALLPKSIMDNTSTASPPPAIPLTTQSASATDVFGGDPNARALAARIRALGATLDQLQIAQAFDDTGAFDISIIAFRLPKADLAKLRAAVIDTWLSARAEGVKTTTITLGGKSVTKVDYGDGSTIEYVYAKADYVIVIDTSDLDVATQAAAQLK
ncbi:MAG TPA: hypothetical protein VHM48_13725 [Candidatus Limnocylindrales bacterium]|nr:hypothetical protein [Candidatus Limnocylindrales bacterium]